MGNSMAHAATLAEREWWYMTGENSNESHTAKIVVYRESPVWDTVVRWWQLPAQTLRDLLIAQYRCAPDDVENVAAQLSAKHPGCVLVY